MERKREVNIFKNFTNFIGYSAAVTAAFKIFVLKEKFKPTDEFETVWETEAVKVYLILAAVFFAAALFASMPFKNPSFALPVSALPVWASFLLFKEKLIPDRPIIYVLLGLIFFAGHVSCAFFWFEDSREYTKNQSRAVFCGFFYAALALALWIFSEQFLSYRWRLFFTSPFYVLSFGGCLCALFGLIWFVKTPKDKRRENLMLLSTLSGLTAFAVGLIRVLLTETGII